jgi:hypothetical protein
MLRVRLIEVGKFELEKMLDDVLAERSRRMQIAASQIVDLLRYMFEIELISAGGSRRSSAARRYVQA